MTVPSEAVGVETGVVSGVETDVVSGVSVEVVAGPQDETTSVRRSMHVTTISVIVLNTFIPPYL